MPTAPNFKCFFLILSGIFLCNPSNAQVRKDSLLKLIGNEKTDTGKSSLYYLLAQDAIFRGDSTTIGYAKASLELAEAASWKKGMAKGHYILSEGFKEMSDFTTAMEEAQIAYEIFEHIKDTLGMRDAARMMGLIYHNLGLYSMALEKQYIALQLSEAAGDQRGIATAFNNIGTCYTQLKTLDKAMEYLNKSLRINRRINDKSKEAVSLANIASVFAEKSNYEMAISHYKQAEKLFEELDDRYNVSLAYINQGEVFMKTENFKAAYDLYIKALKIEEAFGRDHQISYIYEQIADVFFKVTQNPELKKTMPSAFRKTNHQLLLDARKLLKDALKISNTLNAYPGLMSVNKRLAELSSALNDYYSAYRYTNEFVRYKDSMFNNENKNKITALELKYLEDSKNKEISLLNKDKALQASAIHQKNQLIWFIILGVSIILIAAVLLFSSYNRRKKARFAQLQTEMENQLLRLQMNPHFIFNSLHAINNYMLNNEKQLASDYLSRFSQLMRRTLENSRKAEVLLSEDLEALELYIQLESLRFPGGFVYHIDVSPDVEKDNTLVPPMLLQPFVENAIIHGIHNKIDGEISINICLEKNMLKCVVADNGEGFAQQHPNELPENEGSYDSLGVKITRERLKLLTQLKNIPTIFNIKGSNKDAIKLKGVRVELALPYELAF